MAEFDGDFHGARDEDLEGFSRGIFDSIKDLDDRGQLGLSKYIEDEMNVMDKFDIDRSTRDVFEMLDTGHRSNESGNDDFERSIVINGVRYVLGRNGLIVTDNGEVIQPTDHTGSKPKKRDVHRRPVHEISDHETQDSEHELGVLRDLILDIDVNSAEACSVNAQAIRKSVVDRLSRVGKEQALRRDEFADVDILGEDFVLNKAKSDERRVWSVISEAYGVAFVVWADMPFEDKKIFRDVLHNKPEDFAATVLKIGVMFNGYDRKIFVPMLSNSKTENGCHITYPSGQEVDYTAINKPEMLELAKNILIGKIDPGGGWADLRGMIGKTTENHPDVAVAMQLINERVIEPSNFLERLVMANKYSALHPLRLDGGVVSNMNVIAYGDGFEQGASRHTKIQCEFVVTTSTSINKSGSSPCEVKLTLWGGKDPKVYGVENCELVKQFDLIIDELGRSKLMKYQPLSEGTVTREASSEESEEYNFIVNSLTSYDPGNTNNQRLLPANNDKLKRMLAIRG